MDRVEDRQAGFRKRRHERCVDPTRRFACETVHSEAKARDRPHGIVPREVDLGGLRAGEGRRFVRQVSSSTTPSPHSALAIFLLMYSPSCQYSETSSELTASYARPRAASTSATTSLKRASLSRPAGSAVRRSIVSAPLRLSWSSPAGRRNPWRLLRWCSRCSRLVATNLAKAEVPKQKRPRWRPVRWWR